MGSVLPYLGFLGLEFAKAIAIFQIIALYVEQKNVNLEQKITYLSRFRSKFLKKHCYTWNQCLQIVSKQSFMFKTNLKFEAKLHYNGIDWLKLWKSIVIFVISTFKVDKI